MCFYPKTYVIPEQLRYSHAFWEKYEPNDLQLLSSSVALWHFRGFSGIILLVNFIRKEINFLHSEWMRSENFSKGYFVCVLL